MFGKRKQKIVGVYVKNDPVNPTSNSNNLDRWRMYKKEKEGRESSPSALKL